MTNRMLGALGVSLVFVRDIAPKPTLEWALMVAWSLFAGSLVFTFVSLVTSQSAILRRIKECDEGRPEARRSLFGIATTSLNALAATAFVLGVAFLVLFAVYNL